MVRNVREIIMEEGVAASPIEPDVTEPQIRNIATSSSFNVCSAWTDISRR
jgi:hypothetical protein